MFVIIFASARLAIVPTSPESAQELLVPYVDERAARDAGLTADDYAAACQAVAGDEFSIPALIDAGALDEDGNPAEGVVVLRMA